MEATKREKALIFALCAGYIDSWKEAYIYSRDREIKNTVPEKLDPAIVTRWKQRLSIQKALQDAQEALKLRDEKTAEKARREMEEGREREEGQKAGGSERTNTKNPGKVDFYDPKNQRNQINKIIANAQDDPKTQLDAIKAIQQTQRDDRQAAKEGKTVRVYMPISCDICPMYQKRRKKG